MIKDELKTLKGEKLIGELKHRDTCDSENCPLDIIDTIYLKEDDLK